VVYFASDRAPNVGYALDQPNVQAPKPNMGGAGTYTRVAVHADKVGGGRHALDVASVRAHIHHDATLLVPSASQL